MGFTCFMDICTTERKEVILASVTEAWNSEITKFCVFTVSEYLDFDLILANDSIAAGWN